ncbi:MAG: SIMPL domain-containing protein [Gammaproteobacteria bacterium]|nr:SIMPL domain-containing protein [Gammaproteobacteria bacterium]NND55310.1 SIMPL domain-containing protein [Gammaproteobacteria bacterium]
MRTRLIALILLAANTVALADDNPRTVSVSGKATVTAQPDIARISMSVVERNKSLNVAQQSASATTAKILRLLDRLKIDRKRIDTTGLNIRPDYRWNRTSEQQELIGYVVERQIMVELRDLDNLGKLLEGAVEAGANQVSPPGFDRTDRAELHRRALADAIRDARANADVMVAAAGAEIGNVMTISSSGMPSQPRPMMRAMAADAVAESAEASYVTGDIRFEAFVNIVYELAP